MNTTTLQLQRPQDPLSSRQSPGDGSTMLGTPAVSDSGRSEETLPRPETQSTEPGNGAVSTSPDQRPKGRRTTTLSVASLNSRGLNGTRRENRNKLASAVRIMRESKWGILGVQETHESTEAAERLERSNQRVWTFPNPGTAFSAGTTLIVYKDFFPYKTIERNDVEHKILIEGRAHMITLPWQEGEKIDVVNIYAPNDVGEAITFFNTLKRKLRRHPSILMGDFNHVEHMIDRLPQRDTDLNMRNALTNLRTGLGLTDGWRQNHRNTLIHLDVSGPDEWNKPQVQARPDPDVYKHDGQNTEIVDERDPRMGTSRWRMNENELSDEYLRGETLKILRKAESQMNNGCDAMIAWLNMKTKLKTIFTEKKRELTKIRSAKLANLEKDRDKCKAHPDYAANKQIQRNCEAIEGKITSIRTQKTAQAVLTQTARYRTLGESVSKYWFSIGKSLMNDSMIRSLKDKDRVPRPFTEDMLQIAAEHHENLMANPEMTPEREEAIKEIVEIAKRTPLSLARAATLSTPLNETEAEIAVKVAQTGKAPGEDGITYEFYKKWIEIHKDQDPEGERVPSIINMMVRAWNAPSRRTKAQAEYVKGLMALLYKKGDKDDVANYRPITLLNTDEKLETKCLATRLGLVLPSVIHPDQAGFVPGRDILDHVKLAKVVAEYCEVTEQNGCLVALDQEKAYDRIDHTYLWKILEAVGIPHQMIQRVQALYANATTQVMINRMTSRPFPIKRGVRQGDPMSCLLFDLAIEPLAEKLRMSTLRGIRVPGTATRLVCKLFADDTQLYLSKRDSYRQAMDIASQWIVASTARFNENKTEVLPMGKPSYRTKVVETRTIAGKPTPNDDQLPAGARIVGTGETLRILGGRIGYNTDIEEVWQPTVDKMEKAAKKWSSRNLTMKGRALIASFIILSMAQFLTMVNEPSKNIITRVDRILRKLMWKEKARGILRLDVLQKPVSEGGTGLPLLGPRTRAARIMWLKKWRLPLTQRPQWTIFLESILQESADGTVKPWMKSILDQTWKTRKGGLTKETRNLLKEAETSNLTVDALKMGSRAKLETILWRTSNSNKTPREENSAVARRLWLRHGVQTQADQLRIKSNPSPTCRNHEKCVEAAETWIIGIKPKVNMLETTPKNRWTGQKDNLDLTARRKEANVINRTMGNPVLLDPKVTHDEALVAASRVFAPQREGKDEIAYRQTNLRPTAGTATVYTDGSADINGFANSACGAGLWSTEPNVSGSVRIPGYPPSNNRGELAAAMLALERVPINKKLIIRTDSTYVMNLLDGGFQKHEDKGWLNVTNADLLKRCLYLLRRRVAGTLIQKVKAHSGDFGNEAADEAAKEALTHEETELNLEVPQAWDLRGAKLSTLSFHDAYEWAVAETSKELSTRAVENITRFTDYVGTISGKTPLTAMLWESYRSKDLRREVSDFLWQAAHGRTVCGPFFRHWGGEWTERQFCRCGALEDLEHILIGCQEREWREALWDEYRRIEGMASAGGHKTPLPPQYEDIMTVGLYKAKTKPATRIHKILLSETAFVIWKMRNEEVIREERVHPRRAKAALHAALFKRAEIDLVAARLPDNPLKKRRNYEKTVKASWNGLVDWTGGRLVWVPSDYG